MAKRKTKVLKFIGTVRTNRAGSACTFEFEVDEARLPRDADGREAAINKAGLAALWESGQVEWAYEPAGEEP